MTTKKEKKKRTSDYKEFLRDELSDLDTAAGYLTAAFQEGEDVFMLAIRDVVDAHGGIGPLATATALNREGLYDMLSKKGNPRLTSLNSVLKTLGLTVNFSKAPERKKKAA